VWSKTKVLCYLADVTSVNCLSRNIFGKSLALNQIFETMLSTLNKKQGELKYLYVSANAQSDLDLNRRTFTNLFPDEWPDNIRRPVLFSYS
jgi:hypothetical protein